MSPQSCPLGDEHCAALDRVLTYAPQTLELARQCVLCGLPADQQVVQLQAQIELAQRLRDTFFKGKPYIPPQGA